MKLPTEKQCLDYFTRYNVPKNIFAHCLKVREVSVFLCEIDAVWNKDRPKFCFLP